MRKLTKTEEEIVNRVQELLENGVEGWKKGWVGVAAGMPYNAISKIEYKGINAISLFMAANANGYEDPRWLTWNQIKEKGYSLDKGAKGARVEFWSRFDPENKRIVTDEYALEKKKNLSEEDYEAWLQSIYMITRDYTVFNASCVPELAKIKPVMNEEEKAKQIKTAEKIISNSFVPIIYGGGSAYYSMDNDNIHLPQRTMFFTQEEFYGTALHEMVHATGAKSRLARDMDGLFGSEQYAKEELVAELGSMFLQAELGVKMSDKHFENHVAYLKSWKKAIESDPSYFIQAITPAKKATEYVLGVAKVEEKNQEIESKPTKIEKKTNVITAQDYKNAVTPEAYWKAKNLQSVNKCDAGIPEELKVLKGWCAYKVYIDKEKGTRKKFVIDCNKVPKADGSLTWAKCNDSSTWTDYNTALTFAKKNNCLGLSLVLTPEMGYSCIDLDHVIDENGKMSEAAWTITELSKDTYIEKSSSGKGLHIFFKGNKKLDGYRNRNDEKGIEVYDDKKFISMTGENFNGTVSCSEFKPELISYLKQNLEKKQSTHLRVYEQNNGSHTDEQVIDMIMRSTKKNDFEMMFKAGVDIKGNSSVTDASLINLIYFYSEDPVQTKRLFMESGRYRPEKGEKYVDRTVNFVVSHISETRSEMLAKRPQQPLKSKSKTQTKSK